MTRYSVQPRDQTFVKSYKILKFATKSLQNTFERAESKTKMPEGRYPSPKER